VADDDAIDGERNRARHHRLSLQAGVLGSVLIDRDPKRGECDRGRCPEQAGEALRTQKISQHREGRYDGAPDEEADDVLSHFALFQSFESGPPAPYTGSLRGTRTFGMVFSARGRSSTVVHSSYVPVGG